MKQINDNVWVIDHPFAQELLSKLRDKDTSSLDFRKGVAKLGRFCGYELYNLLDMKEVDIQTPIAIAKGLEIYDKENIIVVNILRAATPLVEGLLKAFPDAKQGVISCRRVEEKGVQSDGSMEIESKYLKMPPITNNDTVILSDPMFATGSTITFVIDKIIKDQNPKRIIMLSVISSQYAVDKLSKMFPDVKFVTISIDKELNEQGYIVPGLGDAGDRAFKT